MLVQFQACLPGCQQESLLHWLGLENTVYLSSAVPALWNLPYFLDQRFGGLAVPLGKKLVQQDFEWDQPYTPCRTEKLEWQKGAFSFSFLRWKVGRAIISGAAGILFKYCKKTALKILLFKTGEKSHLVNALDLHIKRNASVLIPASQLKEMKLREVNLACPRSCITENWMEWYSWFFLPWRNIQVS